MVVLYIRGGIMPEKYAILIFLIIACGICIIFGGIYQEPLLILLIVGLIIVICTIIIFMLDDHNNKN